MARSQKLVSEVGEIELGTQGHLSTGKRLKEVGKSVSATSTSEAREGSCESLDPDKDIEAADMK